MHGLKHKHTQFHLNKECIHDQLIDHAELKRQHQAAASGTEKHYYHSKQYLTSNEAHFDKFKAIKMNGESLLSNSRANKKYAKNMMDIEFL